MAQIVKLRRSAVSGQKPTNSNLQLGELAQNTTDGKIFLAKSGSGGPSIEEIIVTNTSNTGSINLLGSVTASSFTGSFIGDGALLYNIPASGVTGLQLDRISSGNVSASISPSTGLVINTGVTITGSISATEFTGSGLGLTNVPFQISGSDVDGNTYDKQFTKLQFDDSTGLNVSESVDGTAFISIGSHFRDIFVSGSDMLRATGSDAFEIIPEGGIEITTSITDTNSNGYIKELKLSTTTLSSSLNTRIQDLSGSVVYQSETSSMTVLSSSFALTASFALNAGAGNEGRTFVHVQSTPSTYWIVTHNLGEEYPAITVFDSSDNVIIPSKITTIDETRFTVEFSSNQTGRVSATVGGGLPFVSASFVDYVLAVNNDVPYWKGGIISGSSQVILTGTTGYSTFSSSIDNTITSLSSSIAATDLLDDQRLDSIESTTASLNSYTSSTNGRLNAIETSTGSLNTFSSSTLSRLSSLETESGSIRTDFNTFTSSYTIVSSSLDSRLDVLEAYSGSQQVPTASFSFRTAETSVYCKNSSGYQINKGQVVRIVGSVGDNPLIATASYENDANSANTLGVAKENIPNDSFGMIITEGVLLGVNTLGMTGGDLLYLGANGSFTTVSPTAPLHGVRLGEVLRVQQNNGSIYVRIDNGIELNEAHDVAYTSISSGDLLVRSGSVWINSKQLTGSYHITGSVNATSLTGSINYNNLTNVPTLVSGSSQILLTGTTGYSTFSSSIATTTSNIETRVGSLETESGSIRSAFNNYTSSTNSRLNSIETSTGSLNTFSSSTLTRFVSIETSTSSLNSFSSSTISRLGSIETSTSSLNTFTSSAGGRLTAIETSTGSLNTFTSSATGRLTAIETSTGSLNNFSSSTNTRLGSLETESGSIRTAFNNYTSSNDSTNSTQNSRLTAIETSTSSLNTFSSSTNSRLSSIETSTGSLNTFSSSTNTRLGSLETESGSIRTAFNSYTSSNDSTNTTQNNRLTSLEGKTGSYATTGSNSFNGSQTITGSLIVTADLTVLGSSSLVYVTSSQLSVSSSTISVNVFEPAERFGGLKVYDSGSSTATASLLWDSLHNHWIYQNVSGAAYSGGMFLSGPRNTGSLGDEPGLIANRLPKSVGGDHLDNSSISDTGTKVSINSNTEITGTFVVTGTALVSGSSQIDHNSTTNYVANEHINHTSVSISAGNGLSGGGDISATRTLTLDTGSAHFTGGVKTKMNTDGVVSSSAQIVAALPSGTVSGSSQVLNGSGVWSGSAQLPSGVVSGSSQVSFSGISGVPSGLVSGSSQVSYTGLSNIPSGIVSGSSQVSFSGLSGVPAGLVSGSSQIDHNSTTNYVANQHIDHTTVSISAGNGLSGGGTIAATRTLTLDTGSAHFVSGARNLISVSDTTGASGIDLTYTPGTGVLSGTLVNSAITIAGNSVSLGGSISAATILTSTGVWSGSAQLPSGVVSGSSQVSFSGISGVPSGLVSGSSQISFGSISGVPSGLVSGSSQISFGSISGVPSGLVSGSSQITFSGISSKPTTLSGYGITDAIKSNGTLNNNIDSDWGESFTTFDPIPSGTPPLSSPNIRTINVGPDYNRRTQLAFDYASDKAYFRRRTEAGWFTWREFIHSGNISSQSVSYATTAGALTSMNISQFTNNSGYITSYTETDTLATVTARGASTSTALTLSGKVTFSSTVANRPQFPGGILGLDTGDGNFDIWGISRDYYPSHGTAANAWGLRWNGDNNDFEFVGGGTNRVILDMDGGNITSTGTVTATSFSGTIAGSNVSGNISGNASNITSYTINQNLGTSNSPTFAGLTSNGVGVFNSTNDTQISLRSTDTWAGIEFDDSGSPDYIWYHGGSQTFAIGGGGSNVSGKKLHVHGGMTVGSGYVSTGTQTNGLTVEGNIVAASYVVIGGNYSNNAYNSVTGARLMFGGGDGDAQGNYYIGTNMENYGGNYNKLDLRWHTGIRMGAQPGYGGIRFFDTEDLGTVLFSIGAGDGNVRSHTNLIPSANNSYNLGSASLGWANVYTNDLHLSNMNKEEGNDIDGTNGSWTIQEGAENLYIINNNNGKKYKITLEEI